MEKSVQFTARIPASVMEWLKKTAKMEDRSMNNQMVNVLRKEKAREENENVAQ